MNSKAHWHNNHDISEGDDDSEVWATLFGNDKNAVELLLSDGHCAKLIEDYIINHID